MLTPDRDRIAVQRDRIADDRQHVADTRAVELTEREAASDDVRPSTDGEPASRALGALAERSSANADDLERLHDRAARAIDHDTRSVEPDEWAADRRDFVADDRQEQADLRQSLTDHREQLFDVRDAVRAGLDAAHTAPATTVTAGRQQRGLEAADRAIAGLARDAADQARVDAGSSHPLAAELVAISRSLLRAPTPELAMADVVDAAVRFVNGCSAASFSAVAGDVVTTVASTGLLATELDEAQYNAAEGPVLQAIQTLQAVIAADLAKDERWPEFARVAMPVGSALSTPVSDDRESRMSAGSLNGYSATADAFGDADVDVMVLLTAHLGVLLCLAREARESSERVVQLAEAVQSRDVIGQAKGILMERADLTAGQAFDLLRDASQRLNRKLRNVADELTESGSISGGPTRSSRLGADPA